MKLLPFAALLALLRPVSPAAAQYYQAYPNPDPAYPYSTYPQPYPPPGYYDQSPPPYDQGYADQSQAPQDQPQGFRQDQPAQDDQSRDSQPYPPSGYYDQSPPPYDQGYPDQPQGLRQDQPAQDGESQDSQPYPAQSPLATDINIDELLAAHNAYRTPLGLSPLHWSDGLAANAQQWAEHLVQIGQMQHSGSGQNLAMASTGTQSLTALVDLWGNEQRYFTDGNFPSISTSGDWKDAGHYSQLVWRSTREVGCGFASGNGQDFLVCDYAPVGNVIGQRPY